MRPISILLLALAASPRLASAQDAPAQAPALPAPDLSAPRPAAGLDFDLLAPAPAAAPVRDPAFERLVARRRTMLRVHQGMGIATWAALAATAVVGQLEFNDRFRGGGDTGQYRTPHRALVATSTTLFAASGLLALLAPEPYAKRSGRLDTAMLHKISMGVATAGMLAQVALGLAARRQAGSLQERNLAVAHQVVGYTTLGAMTVGATVLFF